MSMHPMGRISESQKPNGSVDKVHYDQNMNIVWAGDDSGFYIAMSYDEGGNKLTQTDCEGNTERNVYQGKRLERHIDAEGHESRFEYDERGNLTREIDPLGNEKKHLYDARGNKIKDIDEEGYETAYAYDQRGNLTSTTDALGYTYTYKYDACGHRVESSDFLGKVTRSEYDPLGRCIRNIDFKERTFEMTYDGSGFLVSLKEPVGLWHSYKYDKLGNLVEEADSAGRKSTYSRDAQGHMTAYTDSMGNTTRYEYDTSGYKIKMIDALGRETRYEKNMWGTEEKTIYPNGAYTAMRLTPNRKKLQWQRDVYGRENFMSYDGAGNLIEKRNPFGTYKIEYDPGRNPVRAVGPDGNVMRSEYNNRGEIIGIIDERTNKRTTMTYDAVGRLLSWIDHESRVTSYTYDEQGDMLQKVDERGTTAFLYQPGSNRLLSMEGPQSRRSFSFNANGSLTETVSEEGEKTALIWDANNRLKKVIRADGAEITLAYDFEGRRKEKTDPAGNLTEYIYDEAGKLLAERDAEGNLIRTYVYANDGTPLELNQDGKTYFYHTNAHGDVLKLTDGEGNIVAEYSYDPWGKILSASGELSSQPLRYAGYFWDEDLSMYYLIARYYDPEIARFISTDPVKENFSGYIYCNDDPINMTDPMGTEAWFVTAFHITTAIWYEFDLKKLYIKHNLAPSYYGYMITWTTSAASGLEGRGMAQPGYFNEWDRNEGPIPMSAHCRNPYDVLFWSSRKSTYNAIIWTDKEKQWFYEYFDTNGKWPPTLGDAMEVKDWWPIESPINEWWIIWWKGQSPWFKRDYLAIHTGWHGDPYGCHDYKSKGCVKLRPDRQYNFIWIWDMIVYTSWYNSSPYYYAVGAVPWFWVGGWRCENDHNSNNYYMWFYIHFSPEWDSIDGWTG